MFSSRDSCQAVRTHSVFRVREFPPLNSAMLPEDHDLLSVRLRRGRISPCARRPHVTCEKPRLPIPLFSRGLVDSSACRRGALDSVGFPRPAKDRARFASWRALVPRTIFRPSMPRCHSELSIVEAAESARFVRSRQKRKKINSATKGANFRAALALCDQPAKTKGRASMGVSWFQKRTSKSDAGRMLRSQLWTRQFGPKRKIFRNKIPTTGIFYNAYTITCSRLQLYVTHSKHIAKRDRLWHTICQVGQFFASS